jgi:hypothetical protein
VTDSTYWQLIGGALALDPSAFEAIAAAEHGLRQAVVIMLLAGASETLGQCVVLILNRVSVARFCLALFLGGAELVLEAVLWIVCVWLLSGLFRDTRPTLASAITVIGLAYAPLILGFFVFFPSLGPAIARLLRLWALLAAVVGISVVFGVRPAGAGLIAGAGFLGRWVLLRLFDSGWSRATGWWWRASTGRSSPLQSSEALMPPDARP